MTFNEYQQQSRKTAQYPNLGSNFVYPTLGLVGEAGEVAEKVKKILRDKEGVIDDQTKEELIKEMGDVFWYLAQLATEIDVPLEEVIQKNLEKLLSRLKRNQIHGEWDNR